MVSGFVMISCGQHVNAKLKQADSGRRLTMVWSIMRIVSDQTCQFKKGGKKQCKRTAVWSMLRM